MFYKKGVLEISKNSQENTCVRVSFLIKLLPEACNFIKKEALAQVSSCEFCENFKNTFFYRTSPVACSRVFSVTLHFFPFEFVFFPESFGFFS